MAVQDDIKAYAASAAQAVSLTADQTELYLRVLHTESGYDPNAVGKAGEQGVGQIMPATGKVLGLQDPFDPVENIDKSVGLFKTLLDKYKNPDLALAAYNAGEPAVDDLWRAHGEGATSLLHPEVRAYVDRVFAAPQQGSIEVANAAQPTRPERLANAAANEAAASGVGESGVLGMAKDVYGFLRNVAVPGVTATIANPVEQFASGMLKIGTGTAGASDYLDVVKPALDVAAIVTPAGRVVSSALQGGAALGDALEAAKSASGRGWIDAAFDVATNPTDLAIIGASALAGAAFPSAPSARGLAERMVGVTAGPKHMVGAARAEAQRGALAGATNRALSALPTDTGKVAEAFAKIDKGIRVDGTAYRNEVLRMERDGVVIPRKVQAGLDKMEAETAVRYETRTRPSIVMPGEVITERIPVTYQTGRYLTTSGNLIDTNMRLGALVNPVRARAENVVANDMRALREKLSDATQAVLPVADRVVYANARALSKTTAQNRNLIGRIELYSDEAAQTFNADAMADYFGKGITKLNKTYGAANVAMARRWSKAAQKLQATKGGSNVLRTVWSFTRGGGVAGILAGAAAGAAFGGTSGGGYMSGAATGAGVALPALGLFRLITNPTILRYTEALAQASPTSARGMRLAGRLVLLSHAMTSTVQDDAAIVGGDEGALPPPPQATPPLPTGPVPAP